MSYTFSRRAFLKYSAATAVAVAGASLLGGCEYQDPKNPVCKTLPGAITSDLQLKAGLRSMKIENSTCTMTVDIQGSRSRSFMLNTNCFSVAVIGVTENGETVRRYFSMNEGGVKFRNATNMLINQENPVVEGLELVATSFPELLDGDTVLLQYIPDSTMSNYSLNWEITKEVYDAHNESSSGSGSSEAPEPDASTTA